MERFLNQRLVADQQCRGDLGWLVRRVPAQMIAKYYPMPRVFNLTS